MGIFRARRYFWVTPALYGANSSQLMEKSTVDSTDNARLCAALYTISTNSIPSVALGLGLLYLLLAVNHMMVLPPPLQTPMTAAAGISAALLLTLRLVLGHYPMLRALRPSPRHRRRDGVYLPAEFDLRRSTTLGLQLVNGLVTQIKGQIEASGVGGAHFTITVPI